MKLSKELSVLRNTTMPAALIEVDFISNAQAEKDLKVSANVSANVRAVAVAVAIKNNLVKLLDLEVATNDTWYKVCIGAYRYKNNALNQVESARDKGFKDVYII
ncbi:MAG: hypothetical protein RSD36_12940 [Terrisporobacter sp.]